MSTLMFPPHSSQLFNWVGRPRVGNNPALGMPRNPGNWNYGSPMEFLFFKAKTKIDLEFFFTWKPWKMMWLPKKTISFSKCFMFSFQVFNLMFRVGNAVTFQAAKVGCSVVSTGVSSSSWDGGYNKSTRWKLISHNWQVVLQRFIRN